MKLATLLATHNDHKTLLPTLTSIFSNSYPSDVFVIDDGSSPPIQNIPPPHLGTLRITNLSTNIGPARARNIAIQQILEGSYAYVAIMDADDMCHPERFAKQIAFLETNPHIAAVGSWARFIGERTREPTMYYNPPTGPEEIRSALFFNSCFIHPSMMIRSEVLREMGGYDESFPVAQDYELLYRISQRYNMANLPEYLLDYRISSGGISVKKRRKQVLARLRIQVKYFNYTNWRAYAGVMKTLVLLYMPIQLISWAKSKLSVYARKL